MGWPERTASKHVYYQVWNRSPVQVGCMRQVLGPGALGRPRGIGWRGRWEGESGWGIHVNPRLIHVNVRQKPLQYCKVISLQLITINEKKKKNPSANAGDRSYAGSISGSGRSPGEGNGNPLHYSCLEKSMGRGTWWAVVRGVTKSQTWLSNWTKIILTLKT